MHMRWLVSLMAIAVAPVVPAQIRRPSEQLPSIRANVELVPVPVTVTDRRGATVTGIERGHFTVLQDNVPQNILSFARQDVPCSVNIIVDTSGSMLRQLDAAKSVVRAFLETAADNEASLMSVSAGPRVEIQKSLRFERAGGATALVDTLYMALNRMRSAHYPRRALLVVSDGIDNHSRYSKDDLMRIATEADVQIYSISGGVAPSLEELAEKTGGLHFSVEFPGEAEKVAKQAGMAIRNQYMIGYRPQTRGESGRWHKIRVKLDVPNTNVYTRSGYYSR